MPRPRGTFLGYSGNLKYIVRFDLREDGATDETSDIATRSASNMISIDMFEEEYSFRRFAGTVHARDPQFFPDRNEIQASVVYRNRLNRRPAELPGDLTITLSTTGDLEIDPHRAVLILRDRETLYRYAIQIDQQESDLFREVRVEIDMIQGTEPVEPFEDGSVRRTITSLMRDAGIVVASGIDRVLPMPLGAGSRWDEQELHDFMVQHFSNFDRRQIGWEIYFLIATEFRDPATSGIMFDYQDNRQRQGVAVFHSTIAQHFAGRPDDLEYRREYLRTAVHELGHAFNLLHPFDPVKPGGLRRRSTSFMNYPHEFRHGSQQGSDAYWTRFGWSFDEDELRFLRHGHLEEVVMGGAPFGSGGGVLDRTPIGFERASARLDYRLEIRVSPKSRRAMFEFGEPVHLESVLRNLTREALPGSDTLDPVHVTTQYLIQRPNGQFHFYSPCWYRCTKDREIEMHPERRPAIYEDVSLAFDARRGFTFMEPGRYRIQAIHEINEDSFYSNVMELFVRYPTRELEDLVVPTFDESVQRYLCLWGTDTIDTSKLDVLEAFVHSRLGRSHPLYMAYAFARLMFETKARKEIDLDRKLVREIPPKLDDKLINRVFSSLGINEKAQVDPNRLAALSNPMLNYYTCRIADVFDKFDLLNNQTNTKRFNTLVDQSSARFREDSAPAAVVQAFSDRTTLPT